MDLFAIIVFLASIVRSTYAWNCFIFIWIPNNRIKTSALFWMRELRPFFMPSASIVLLNSMLKFDWWWLSVLMFLLDYFLYKLTKHINDDRWKKRRKKLVEKVQLKNGKLVVVPNHG